MKNLLLFLLTVGSVLSAAAQQIPGKALSGRHVIESYRVDITYDKTVHILFPATITYVDLGSADLIAGKAEGAENVLRVKAAVRDFPGETNFSVITSDGCFYSFLARYVEQPAQLNIEMRCDPQNSPQDDAGSSRVNIRLDELGGAAPQTVDRVMSVVYEQNARDIKTVGSKRFGIQVLLQGVYIHAGVMYLHTSISNFTNIPFDIDFVRLKVVDKKVPRRTAVQETIIQPLRVYRDVTVVAPHTTVRNVYALRKLTIPDDKQLTMEIYERDGGRHQSFGIENDELIRARVVDETKIK